MLNPSLIRLNNLNGENREDLYDKYKEWLEVDDDNVINVAFYTEFVLPKELFYLLNKFNCKHAE